MKWYASPAIVGGTSGNATAARSAPSTTGPPQRGQSPIATRRGGLASLRKASSASMGPLTVERPRAAPSSIVSPPTLSQALPPLQ